jgi:exodeoxyribonuclease VII small subunit
MSKKIKKPIKKSKQISYELALSRLQEILEGLQEEKINVDELSEQLQEAYQLVSLCRQKIKSVETEIQKIDKEFKDKE